MGPEHSVQLESIFRYMSVGVAIIDCSNWRIRYANPYLLSLLDQLQLSQVVIGRRLDEVIPEDLWVITHPFIEQVCATGRRMSWPDIPYEGFLARRGRTSWRVTIERTEVQEPDAGRESDNAVHTVLVTIEDVTELARSRLYVNAIDSISSAIVGPFALPLVLERILQAVQEMVGSTRCAILLIDDWESGSEYRYAGHDGRAETDMAADKPSTVSIAAQKGVHLRSQDWHPQLSEQLFLRIDQLAKDASRNLRQREYIMQAIPDGVIIYDSRWRVVEANQSIRKLLGWTNDVIGLHITEALAKSKAIFSQDYKSKVNFVSELDERTRVKLIDEVKLTGADGQHYTLSRSYAPIHDELGDVFASVVIYHDVTEHVLARERIEAEVIERTAQLAQRNAALELARFAQDMARARMELLLERLPSGVILISAGDRSISIINRQATQILQNLGVPIEPLDDLDAATRNAVGGNAEELLRMSTVYASSGSPVPYDKSPLALALNQGEASEAELHAVQPGGQNLYLLVSAAPLRASDGTIRSAVLVLHETTRLKTLERAREDFFTTMAHELKTPLANIRAHVSALLAEDLQWSREAQRDFLQSADEQVERLVGMINHFLDASRVEAGALRLELEPILLPEMLEDLEERLEALITSSGRHLEVKMPANLPAVMADYELIISVLTNLLSNAFRYAPEGDTVLLELEAVYGPNKQSPKGVELRVTDRGPGMSMEQQNALFTRS